MLFITLFLKIELTFLGFVKNSKSFKNFERKSKKKKKNINKQKIHLN